MPLNLRQVDLRELVASVCEPLLPVIGHRSLVRDLPAHPVLARCDPKLIERVLDNLLSNAIKFTPDGGAIRVTIAAENDCAKVSISDSGPGVPAEYHARIFEKFGQVEGRQDRHSTGLGLSFCKLAVEAQGGRIGVENTNERGTVFWFTTAPWK
jgi:two-component system sensor histidine kinase/response regulator